MERTGTLPNGAGVHATSEATYAVPAQGFTAELLPGMLQRIFSLRAVVTVAMAALVLMAVPHSMADPDIWWHLRNADEMLRQHAFVRHDLYSFTVAGAPWIDHEWLGEIAYWLGWKVAGAQGVLAVGASLVMAIFTAVLWLCWRASGSMAAACGCTVIAALLSTVSFGPRTLLFGWLLFCVQMVLLECFRHSPRAVLLMPPLYLLWVNLHGSWLIGLAVLCVIAVAGNVGFSTRGWLTSEPYTPQQNRMLLFAGVGIIPALFCNPWGWRLVAYPFNFAFRQTLNVATLEEWRPLDLHSVRGDIVVTVLLLVVARQFLKPRAWNVSELLLFAGGLYAALLHTRFLFMFALLAAPVVARCFHQNTAGTAEKRQGGSAAVYALVMCLIALFAAANYRKAAAQEDTKFKLYPTAALPALDRLPPGARLFNEFGWGGYLAWSRPTRAVFIDSRTDIFEYNGVLQDYLDIIRIKQPLAVLDRHRIDAVLFEQDTPLAYLLARTDGWRVVWSDAHTVLFVRSVRPPAKNL